jgi:putative ABC transport system permease protein
MLINYLKTAIRVLQRNKTNSLINLFGLTIGITGCILILLYVLHELSYDRFHEKSDRTYRVYIEAFFMNNHIRSAVTSARLKDALEADYAEVEQVTRILPASNPVIRFDDLFFEEGKFLYADSCFFETFTFPFLYGQPEKALTRPYTMVISEGVSRKYFGTENPVGKVVTVNQRDMEITGVIKEIPGNSHFQFHFLGSLSTLDPNEWSSWLTSNLYTYVVMKPGIPAEELEAKFPEMVLNYVGPEVQALMGIDLEAFEAMGHTYGFFMEPLTDIHLHSNLDNQLQAGGNISSIYFLSFIAAFLLIIACINFMNLATASFMGRAREVGIRKVSGSSRKQLILQFLTESIVLVIISVFLGMVLAELILPQFSLFTGKELVLNYLVNWQVIPGLLLFSVMIGLLAGSYPSIFLSSFKPIEVLKGKISQGMQNTFLRTGLVLIQFIITISLISGTLIVWKQLNFIRSRDLGFQKEAILVLHRSNSLGDQQGFFREELLKHPDIVNASYCSNLPGYDFGGTSVSVEGLPAEEMVQAGIVETDEHYLDVLEIKLEKGRFFSEGFIDDENKILINEKLASQIDLQDDESKRLLLPDTYTRKMIPMEVAGIVKDINYESLHQEIKPMIYRLRKNGNRLLALRIHTTEIDKTIRHIQTLWTRMNPDQPFSYTFLDEDLEVLYRKDRRTGVLFSIFSVLSIVVACLGLLGMSAYSVARRTKEIGIRKALGASVAKIFLQLSRETLCIILIATLIAWPLAWLAMSRWLEHFAYRTDISPYIFLLSTIIASMIALVTNSLHSIKAARANPVDSLKYE